MFINLLRIIKYGWQSFLRNGLLSISTIVVLVLAVVVLKGLILFNVIGKSALVSIQDQIDISVYFKANASEDSILDIKRSLEGLSEVKEVEYLSRERALDEFIAQHEGDDTIIQALGELDENPLLASLNIKAWNPREYENIASYLGASPFGGIIETITFAQSEVVINRLISLIDTLRGGGIVLTVFLALLAAIVTFNTIRLAIFANGDQISIMRLVGASNSFIRGPFIVEGIIYGIIAAILGFFILIPVVNFISPYISNFIPDMDLEVYVRTNAISLFGYQLLFAVGLGVISSSIAVRKYLRI